MELFETLAEHSTSDFPRDFCSRGKDNPPENVALTFSGEHVLVCVTALLHIVYSAPAEPAVWGLALHGFGFCGTFSDALLLGYQCLRALLESRRYFGDWIES